MTFQNEFHRLRENLLKISDQLRMEMNELLEANDLTPQQYNALSILRDQKFDPIEGSFSTQDLRAQLLDKMSDTPRLVIRLLKKGLIDKKPCTHDGRRVHLWITDQGMSTWEAIDQKMHELDSLFGALDLGEASAINTCLEKLLIEEETSVEA